MIRAVLFTLRHPRQFVECLAERTVEHDPVYTELAAQEKAADRSTRRINRKVKQLRSTDPITGALRGTPRTPQRRKKPL